MFKKYQQVHFVGIGGIGMSGIAEGLLNLGYKVTGSDIRSTTITDRLEQLGATIYPRHAAEKVKSAHVVVISSAGVPGQPGKQGSASPQNPGDRKSRDAGRAGPVKVRDHGRGDAWKDYDDFDDCDSTGSRRIRSNGRCRRPAEYDWQQRPAGQRRLHRSRS